MSGPYVERTTDADGCHRARVKGANHEPMMAITEGIEDQRDVETALLRTLEALLTDEHIAENERWELVLRYLERQGALPASTELLSSINDIRAIEGLPPVGEPT